MSIAPIAQGPAECRVSLLRAGNVGSNQPPQQDSNSAAGGASVLTEMLGVVRSVDDATKARIWCALNRNEWPEELARLKPENFDDISRDAQHMLMWKLMEEEMDSIGLRACLR